MTLYYLTKTEFQEAINGDKLSFKRYVSNGWLSVGPMCYRVLMNTENTLIQETRKELMEPEALPAPHKKHKK